MNRLVGTLLVGYIHIVSVACSAYEEPVRVTIEDALSHVRSDRIYQAHATLDQLSDDEAIGQVLSYLNNHPNMEEQLHRFCFRELVRRGFGKTDSGYDFFVESLADPTVQEIAVLGIADAPSTRRSDAIALILGVLDNESEWTSLDALVNKLSDWGDGAKQALPIIERVFHNTKQETRTRSIAAKAMSRIGGPDYAIPLLMADPEAEIHLWPLAAFPLRPNDEYQLDEANRKLLQQFVIRLMKSPEKRVREDAFELLALVYQGDFLIGNETNGFQVNPEFRKALEYMAANETDPNLQRYAQDVVDTLDQRLEKAIRRRRNPHLYVPRNQSSQKPQPRPGNPQP